MYPAAVVSQCRRRNCELDLTALPAARTVLDGDLYTRHSGRGGAMCDFLVFWSGQDLCAAAVEMKSTAWNAGKVR
jgi:hypothetical protein